jgi:hypothetical protein
MDKPGKPPAGLPPPDARGDRAAWQFANRRGRALEPIDLLLHATDQGTRLVFPIHAFGWLHGAAKRKMRSG